MASLMEKENSYIGRGDFYEVQADDMLGIGIDSEIKHMSSVVRTRIEMLPGISVEQIVNDVLRLLTAEDPNEDKLEQRILNYLRISPENFINIIYSNSVRSDVRGYCVKIFLRYNVKKEERFQFLQSLSSIIADPSMIGFGLMFALEELNDIDSIRFWFLNSSNRRIRETALQILESNDEIFTVLK